MSFFLMAWAPAASALTVNAPYPGRAGRDNAFRVTEATPGATVRLVGGTQPGATPVPGCPGLMVDLDAPLVFPSRVADGLGEAWYIQHVPAAHEGQTWVFQVVQRATCEVSAPLVVPWPTGFDAGLETADARFYGEAAGDLAGVSLATAGDFDGDGLADLLMGANGHDQGAGAVYVRFGPVAGPQGLGAADVRFLGGAVEAAGRSVASIGDLDGDGNDDILIGATGIDANGVGAGGAYVVYGPRVGDVDLTVGVPRLLGAAPGDRAGVGVSAAGDVNGDGMDDLLVGAKDEDTNGASAGATYLIHGPVVADTELANADARLLGEWSMDYAGRTVAGPGDVDGDGFDDILVGAHRNDAGGEGAGAAYLVRGPVTGDLLLASADARMRGEAAWDEAGIAVSGAGDVDGDGRPDLLVGGMGNDEQALNTGAAYLLLGGTLGELALSDADARIRGETDIAGRAGVAVAAAGDVNSDGFGDILVGAHNKLAPGPGAAYLVYGPVRGEVDLTGADGRLRGEVLGDWAGVAVGGAGDTDGDGFDDILVGATLHDAAGADAGIVYFLRGPL